MSPAPYYADDSVTLYQGRCEDVLPALGLAADMAVVDALEAGWTYSQDVVWEKHNGSGSAADRFRRVHEHAVMLYRGAWSDVWAEPQFSADATPRQVRRKQRPTHWGEIGESAYVTEDGGPRLMRSVMYERSVDWSSSRTPAPAQTSSPHATPAVEPSGSRWTPATAKPSSTGSVRARSSEPRRDRPLSASPLKEPRKP